MVYRVPASTTKSPPNQKRLFGDQVAHASDRLLHGVTVAGRGHRTISTLGAPTAELGEVVRTAPERFFCAIAGSVVTGHSRPDRDRSPTGRARQGGRNDRSRRLRGEYLSHQAGAGEAAGPLCRVEADLACCPNGHSLAVVMPCASCSRSRC